MIKVLNTIQLKEHEIKKLNLVFTNKHLTLRCSAISFSSTLQIIFSLSLSRMYTSMYALEYFVNLNGELLNPGFVWGSCLMKTDIVLIRVRLK